MPVTISGVTSDKYSEPASDREFRFHSPYAHSVPMTVETTVATTAMIRLFHGGIQSTAYPAAPPRYQRSEKPSHTVKRDGLKLKTARISSGKCRNR